MPEKIKPEKTLIRITNLSYTYPGCTLPALDNISFEIHAGERIALLGANGSGKSTLANCINDLEKKYRRLGIVLQNPDDQIISSIVEEDTAFGPENLGLSETEIQQRVHTALDSCDLLPLKKRQTRFLSGGERQRLSLAGVLALDTEIIILDEAVSMLDPQGKEKFLALLDKLSAEGKTIIQITHSLKEAFCSGRCLVLFRGSLVFDGSPKELIERPELESWGFVLPNEKNTSDFLKSSDSEISENDSDSIVSFFDASHMYKDTGAVGMDKVNLKFDYGGSLIALIGQSGCGKSTLLKHINALLLPSEGRVTVLGNDTLDRRIRLSDLRNKAALSVQNPESALFERYVADDVAFGPKNAGLHGTELVDRVKTAMENVGLPFAEFADRETRSLSGGEKRLAAIAGTAAMQSDILLLDEPLAGLDGFHRKKIMELIDSFRRCGKLVIISTHSMESAALADKVVIMEQGKIISPNISADANPIMPHSKKTLFKKNRKKTGMEVFRIISFGEFLDRPSVLRNLNGGSKLVLLLFLIVAALALPAPFAPLGVLLTGISAGYCAGKIEPRRLLKGFFRILPILLVISLFQLLFQGDEINIIRPLSLILRVAAISVLVSLFSAVTPLQEMLGSIRRVLSLPGSHFFARDIALAAGIALRFIPVLTEEAERIVSAQLSRGGRKGRISMTISIIVPLFLRALERSETLIKAMMLRCYRRR